MGNTSFIETYNRLIKKLTSVKWLQKWDFDKNLIHNYIKNKTFTDNLDKLISTKDFSAKSTLTLCEDMLNKLAGEGSPSDWMNYIYEYTLNKNFPEACSVIFPDKLSSPSELYLRIFRELCYAQKSSLDDSFQSRYPMNFLTLEEENELEHPEEYRKFVKAFYENYTYEMMKINGELTGYNTLDHVCGVHYLSLYIARQIKILGIPVDLGRVSGAAAGHDIGKYGCKGEELKRVPHLHYYYTDQWFKKCNINYIRNIALNHSTWDLELENLSLESLLLIYSDFRIKNEINNGIPKMKIFSLQESFYVILNKLENVNEEKVKRYKKVYSKLRDFEEFLLNIGVDIELNQNFSAGKKINKNYTLLQGQEIIQNLKYLSINHNINLMHQLRDEYSLDIILDQARSEKDWKNLREYIRIFQEYSTYLTEYQKLQTIKFLYENLTHPEDDIRRHCAELIGSLIAIFDKDYRKEIPKDVQLPAPTVRSFDLLKEYLHSMLCPSHNIIDSHKFNIGYSISIMINSLFINCRKSLIRDYRNIILDCFNNKNYKSTECELFLLESAKYIPLSPNDDNLEILFSYVFSKLKRRNSVVRLQALETILYITRKLPEEHKFRQTLIAHFIYITSKSRIAAENLLLLKINTALNITTNIDIFKQYCKLTKKIVTEIFLNNLKTATDWVRKKNQIELLLDYALQNHQFSRLQTSIHFCNLLKVSAIESVRNKAGNAVLQLMPKLTLAERNEVALELLKALEIEGNRFTEYIPRYTGQALLWLQPKELDELINDCIIKIKTSNNNLKSLILKTIGMTISNYESYRTRFEEKDGPYFNRLNKMLSLLLNCLGDYESQVKQSAFSVIGKEIFGNPSFDLRKKEVIFKLIAKKMLTLVTTTDNQELLFLTRSASLNHIYRFISDFTFFHGDIDIPIPSKIAFFPGTFDPFSVSHKELAKHVESLGFQLYLAIDEFSWSKNPLPSLLRRNIVNMSIADELNMYIYPDAYPINIANEKNLKYLRDSFPASEVYIIVGSDVMANASSYKMPKTENSIHKFSHIVFERGKSKEYKTALKNIDGDILIITLTPKYLDISSTQIRHNIDENKDISTLVDPVAQQYIYKNGFYQREAQDKSLIKSLSLDIEIIENFAENTITEIYDSIPELDSKFKEMLMKISLKPSPAIALLRNTANNKILGFSVFHWTPSSMIYDEFKNSEVCKYIREKSVGRIILIDSVFMGTSDKYLERLLLNETLSMCVSKDYEYAIYKNVFDNKNHCEHLYDLLRLNGFIRIPFCDDNNPVYAVNMSSPCILNLDIENMLKEPFRNNPKVKLALSNSRKKLLESICRLYPGELILSFDVNFVYQSMIRKICRENNVPIKTLTPRKLGKAMCVSYGDILDRYVVPNTVTKALHTEKLFNPDTKSFKIAEFPHYLDIKTQVKIIRSFNRPIILADNLLHKGYRMKALDPIFKNENIKIQRIVVGVLSGRGKDLMDMQEREVDAVHFIPRLKIWFNENSLYPFIGGDAVWRGAYLERNLLPSVNLILPYTYPTFIRNTSNLAIYNLSKTCVENAISILEVIEDEYHFIHEKNLNLYSLGQVFNTPRCPDLGKNIDYNLSLNPSSYLKNDLEKLIRLECAFQQE